ncbi:MAG: Rrf2 family transcriptional regulator [Lentisphaerae bacterium]|nr:Rrf2 family transcriptional regulator [Lentisphaerota bacterium]MCP4100871.1 Rrf2 family transcriptional regulator [Lentisphaerota bacterium]
MKLTVKTICGLRILLELAKFTEPDGCLKGKVLVANLNISESFLEQLMINLRRGGLVKTRRGCQGGYYLGDTPENINLLRVIELFEGCILRLGCDSETCSNSDCCCASTGLNLFAADIVCSAKNINLVQLLNSTTGFSEKSDENLF